MARIMSHVSRSHLPSIAVSGLVLSGADQVIRTRSGESLPLRTAAYRLLFAAVRTGINAEYSGELRSHLASLTPIEIDVLVAECNAALFQVDADFRLSLPAPAAASDDVVIDLTRRSA